MKEAKYFRAACVVRYWEDAIVNGVQDKHGTLIPCRKGDLWCPTIDLDTGKIEGWPDGTTADIHYKVCDGDFYQLLSKDGVVVARIDNYVPSMLGDRCGDYVILHVGSDGAIENWRPDMSPFEGGQ